MQHLAAAVLTLLLLAAPASGLEACTLWAAAGEAVRGGGTLIAKNRDWLPNHQQTLRTVMPVRGYRYFGLFAEGNDRPGLKAGINEKGLTVVSATAGSLPRGEREEPGRTRGLLVRLLRECDGVAAALARPELFRGPRHLLLADAGTIAAVEIGPEGAHAVRTRQNGTLAQTNHYRDAALLAFNRRIGRSSDRRLGRIEALLRAGHGPWTPEGFAALSDDREGGPDNALWRTGGTPKRERTLAAWIVHTPPAGPASLIIRIANPGEPTILHRLRAADLF